MTTMDPADLLTLYGCCLTLIRGLSLFQVSPSDLHRRNQTITRVVAFMIENAPLLFSLPETVMQDIRACLREVEMRDCPRRRCVSGSDHRAERKPSCHDVGV